MLKIDSNKDKPNHLEYMSYISKLSLVYFDYNGLKSEYEKDLAIQKNCERNALDYMSTAMGKPVTDLKRTTLLDFLIDYEGVPERMLTYYDKHSRRNIMSAKQSILEKVYSSGYCQEFLYYVLGYYESYASLNLVRTNMAGMVDSGFVNNNGRALYRSPFYYSRAVTSRMYAKKINIQQFPLKYVNKISSVKDYFFIWGDFDQVDLNVALNIALRHDDDELLEQLMDEYDDAYEAFARYMYKKNDEPFSYDKFKEERKLYKECVLSALYQMTVKNLASKCGDEKFAEKLHSTINSNEKYKMYKDLILNNNSLPETFSCKCYFGYERIELGGVGTSATSLLNTPIQGTSAEIMELFVINLCRRMYAEIDNQRLFIPLFNRHDEMVFMVHKSIMNKMHNFLDCCSIQIDDWSPLTVGWEVGYDYQVPDESLKRELIQTNMRVPLTRCVKSKRNNIYKASEITLVVECYTYVVGSSSIIIGHNKDYNCIFFSGLGMDSFGSFAGKVCEEFKSAGVDFDRLFFYGTDCEYFAEMDGVELLFSKTTGPSHSSFYADAYSLFAKYLSKKLQMEISEDLCNYLNYDGFKGVDKIWWI